MRSRNRSGYRVPAEPTRQNKRVVYVIDRSVSDRNHSTRILHTFPSTDESLEVLAAKAYPVVRSKLGRGVTSVMFWLGEKAGPYVNDDVIETLFVVKRTIDGIEVQRGL